MNGKFVAALLSAVVSAGLVGCSLQRPLAVNSFQAPHPAAVSKPGKVLSCRVVSFKQDVLPALQASCVACHFDKRQSPGLDLTQSNAYSDLVNRKSRLNPNLVLVSPSSVKSSFLVTKISPKPEFGAAMPPYGRPLTPEEKTLLSEWIEQGAKDN